MIESLPEPYKTLTLVAVLTGLRIGEIAALRWDRVVFLRGTLQVKETYSEKDGFGTPKTRSSVREVPMSEPYVRRCWRFRDEVRIGSRMAWFSPAVLVHRLARKIWPIESFGRRVSACACPQSAGMCYGIRTLPGSASRARRSEPLPTISPGYWTNNVNNVAQNER